MIETDKDQTTESAMVLDENSQTGIMMTSLKQDVFRQCFKSSCDELVLHEEDKHDCVFLLHGDFLFMKTAGNGGIISP